MDGIKTIPPIPPPQVISPPGSKLPAINCKYIDDLSSAVSIDLKSKLYRSEDEIIKPATFHSRTGHTLSSINNPLIPQLNHIQDFARENMLKINIDKCFIMLFNRSRSLDFQPEIYIEGMLLDVVEEAKLLGIIISSDLKWSKHVAHLSTKVRKRLWTLRRIKELGGSKEDLLIVYKLQIRIHTELCCPVFNGGLTKTDIIELESLQKSAAKLILGWNNYKNYKNALELLELPTLEKRRKELCLSFAKKCAESEKFSNWFTKSRPTRKSTKFVSPRARTSAFEKSPLVYLTFLLNEQ